MDSAISNTSPLLYLYRVDVLNWLPALFDMVWIPSAVSNELERGRSRGYDAPDPRNYEWLRIVEPKSTPHEWLSLDLGAGELAAMALALENPECIILLDDALARITSKAAGLTVWGTLRILIEAKSQGMTDRIAPFVDALGKKGMWMSSGIRKRILALADESEGS